jgi:hypothetical protein
MKGSGRNPECKLRRDEPHAMAGRNLHDASGGINQLVRSMSVFRNLKARGVIIGKSGHRDASNRIKLPKKFALSHLRYIMA